MAGKERPTLAALALLLTQKKLRHLAFLVHATPQVMAFAIDFHEHLIKVLPPTRQRTHSTLPLLAELGGKDRTKTVPPELDRLVAHLDPALVEKVLNIA